MLSNNNIAIVAYFNPYGGLDENFSSALKILTLVFDQIIIISTSAISTLELRPYSNVEVIIRPNIGYDFYSYKVGLFAISNFVRKIGTVTFINSSFFITDMLLFQESLKKLIDGAKQNHVVGLTESKQFGFHLQSYLISMNEDIINAKWFKDFFDKVEPQNSKQEIILRYEIGLSQEMIKNGVKLISLYKPDFYQKIYAQKLWMKQVVQIRNLKGVLIIRALMNWNGINWIQFAAKDIAKQFGIIKKELVFSNPNSIPLHTIDLAMINFSKYPNRGLSKEAQKGGLFLQYQKCTYPNVGKSNAKIAILIHLFYADLLGEVLENIKSISDPFDLYFTTPFEGDLSEIFSKSSKIAETVTVCVFPNRGRDIGPFVSLYADGVFDQYSCVLKLHTKKSKYSAKGDEWRTLLYNKVIGNAINARKTCSIFEDQKVGMIGPKNYYLTNNKFWGANYSTVKKILVEAKVLNADTDPELGFFAGSMFWFSPKAFLPLKNLKNSRLEFEVESGKQDGTLAHAFERVFAIISRESGHIVTSLECANLQDIAKTNTLSNRVPVLQCN